MAPISTERLDALKKCCETYGADPGRWPATRREALANLLDTDEAADIVATARSLDGFLDAASAPRMSEDLTNRIIASYTRPKSRVGIFDFLRGVAPPLRLAPAGLLAGVGALGLASGVMSASAQDALTPEYEALAYMDDLPGATLNEDGGLAWDVE